MPHSELDSQADQVLDANLSPLFYQLSKPKKRLVELLVFFSSITVAMGQTIVFTVLQPVGRELGLQPIHVGIIIVGSSIIFATGSNIWGRQSELWGRKAIMLLGLFGYTLGTILFTSVFYLGFEGLLTGAALIVALTLARMAQSTLMSAAPPAASAFIADITDQSTRTAAMARVGTAHSLGTILGPAIAGLLAGFALLAPLYFAALMPLIAALCCWVGLPSTKPEAKSYANVAKVGYFDKRIRHLVFIGIFMFMAFAAMQMTLGFYIQDIMLLDAKDTIKTMGKLSVISAIFSVSSQWILANWMRWPPLWLIRLGIPLITLGVLNVLFALQFWQFGISMALIGCGMGIVGPGYSSAASLQVAPREQGAVAGIVTSCPAIGFVFGPMIGPGLYQIDTLFPYMFTFFIMMLLSIYCVFFLKINNPHPEQLG